jgi:hypothetical protein
VDNRAPILLKPDGSRIDTVDKPSKRDVKGLTELYGGTIKGKFTLLGDKASSVKNKFDNIKRGDEDSGCN